MLIAKEHRERLNLYCMVKRCTQEVAVNAMVGEALTQLEQDPEMKQRMDRLSFGPLVLPDSVAASDTSV